MSVTEAAATLREVAETSNAWPFEEAKKIVARLKKKPKDEVIFETGYGPSGLPHIGTFGEVARTTMVRHAFRVLTDDKIKTRLIAFSDDMDGLRKVPDNVPNKELLAQDLGKPLTKVRDPFGTHPSFGEHNNARLRAFLDTFGFDYEFASATDYYKSGRFDATLLKVLERLDKVMAIMLPSLREERAASYSPFLPICPRTGVVPVLRASGLGEGRCFQPADAAVSCRMRISRLSLVCRMRNSMPFPGTSSRTSWLIPPIPTSITSASFAKPRIFRFLRGWLGRSRTTRVLLPTCRHASDRSAKAESIHDGQYQGYFFPCGQAGARYRGLVWIGTAFCKLAWVGRC